MTDKTFIINGTPWVITGVELSGTASQDKLDETLDVALDITLTSPEGFEVVAFTSARVYPEDVDSSTVAALYA